MQIVSNINMQFTRGAFSIKTNLDENNRSKLENNIWRIGTISDNPGIDDENNEDYYITVQNKMTGDDNTINHRVFKNKVSVKLYDGSVETGHIIHWVKHGSGGWFAITNDKWWDNFNVKGEYIGN